MKFSFFLALFTIAEGSKDAKILKGRLACKNEFPFVVALNGESWSDICGGTLVTLNKVITAGHCVSMETIFGMTTRNVFVVTAGSLQRDIRTKADDAMQYRRIDGISLHPSFKIKNIGSYYHDIAVCVLDKPFVLSPSVKPMKWIWKDKESYKKAWESNIRSGKNCVGIGWGSLTKIAVKPRVFSTYLKVVDLQPTSYNFCDNFWRYKGDRDMAEKGEVCVTSLNDGEGICKGDSGSPLICDGHVFGFFIALFDCGMKAWPVKCLLLWPYMDLYDLGVSYSSSSRLIFGQLIIIICFWVFFSPNFWTVHQKKLKKNPKTNID